MVLQTQPPWCQEEKSHFLELLAIVLPNTAQYMAGFCCCRGILPIPVHLIAHQDPQVLF